MMYKVRMNLSIVLHLNKRKTIYDLWGTKEFQKKTLESSFSEIRDLPFNIGKGGESKSFEKSIFVDPLPRIKKFS